MEQFPLPEYNNLHLMENNAGLQQPHTNNEKFPLMINDSFGNGGGTHRMKDLMVSLALKGEENRLKLRNLVESAVRELGQMSTQNEPLWKHDPNKRIHLLCKEEYVKRFRELEFQLEEVARIVRNSSGQHETLMEVEGTKEIVYVSIPPICVVRMMMELSLWLFAFGDMLSRADVLEVMYPGDPTTLDGSLQVISAEYHGPSPLIPLRDEYFARYCKHFAAFNTWMVVQTSLDEIIPDPLASFIRRPSGCVIEGLPDGSTKVTWIEHVEVDNRNIHPLFKPLTDSKFLFGAKQWTSQLVHHCHYLQVLTQHTISNLPTTPGSSAQITSSSVEEGLLKLCDRLRKSFYKNLSSSGAHVWKPILMSNGVIRDLRVRAGEPPIGAGGRENGAVILSVVATFWLPHPVRKVLAFLQDGNKRSEWDMLATDHTAKEIFRLQTGPSSEKTITVIEMLGEETDLAATVIVQESCDDPNMAHIVYTPISASDMSQIYSGHNNSDDELTIIPSGFVVHSGGETLGGSVVTLLFQLYDKSSRLDFIPPDSVTMLQDLVQDTISTINRVLPGIPWS